MPTPYLFLEHKQYTSSQKFCYNLCTKKEQESRAVARKPRDAAAVLLGLNFANDIHYKFKSSYASFEARLQSSKHTGTKQNLT